MNTDWRILVGALTLFAAIWCIVIAASLEGANPIIAGAGGALCIITALLLGAKKQ